MNEENSQEKIAKVKELRANYKESHNISDLNKAYKECQEANDQGINVSWYFPWVMYDYLKIMVDEDIRKYFHTLDVIHEKGFFTSSNVPLAVQKNFVPAVQNNICQVAWRLNENQDYANLFALYERGIKYFADLDDSMIAREDLFHREKSKFYGKEGFVEAMINTLFTSKELPTNETEFNKIAVRFRKADEYFVKQQIPYYYFLATKIVRSLSSMSWTYYKEANEKLLNICAEAYVSTAVSIPEDTEVRNIVLPFMQKYPNKDESYCNNNPQNFARVIDLLDFSKLSKEDYEKYQSENGKKYPSFVEKLLHNYLKAKSRLHLSGQQVQKIQAKLGPILEKHSAYTWPMYFYCQLLIQGSQYDNARKVGIKLVRDNLANPNTWGILAATYPDNFMLRMACLYQACKRGSMSQKVRTAFIDGLLEIKQTEYYPIIKREVNHLKGKKQVQFYQTLPWLNEVHEAGEKETIQQFEDMFTRILYSDAKPSFFYVDWQSDDKYGVVIPNGEEKPFIRLKIRKKLVERKLENSRGYSAILITSDDDPTKAKFVGKISEIQDSEFTKLYLREEQGIFSPVRDFGFLIKDDQSDDEDYYCNEKNVKENKLRSHDQVSFIAKYSFDSRDEEWKWTLDRIQTVKHADPKDFQRIFCGVITIKKNLKERMYGFINDGNDSCYVGDKLLTKAGIEYDSTLDPSSSNFNKGKCPMLKVLAESKYNNRRQEWEWTAVTVQEVKWGSGK